MTYYWEDFAPGAVREFGNKLVTREEVIRFATEFDPQPFHLNDEAAEAHPLFGRLAASGWHTCSMVMRMMVDSYLGESASLGSPGLENIKWIKPVFPGDVLHVRSIVADARPMKSKPEVGLVRTNWEVFARRPSGEDDLVLTMEGWSMFRRRQPQPA
jgi:acyl dehydratase